MNRRELSNGVIAIFLVCLAVVALVVSAFGLMLIDRDAMAITNYQKILPLFIGIYLCFIVLFFYVKENIVYNKSINISLLKTCIIVFSVIVITMLSSAAIFSYFMPYAMPLAFVSLTITVLLKQRIGIVSTLMTAMAMTFLIGASPEHFDFQSVYGILLSTIAGLFMVYLLGQGYTRFKITVGTVVVAILIMPVVLLIIMIEKDMTWLTAFKRTLGNFVGNMGAIAAFTVMLPLYEVVFRVWTDFKLAEICSFNNPLLKQLREEAPGTFNHSIIVANLAENCAIAIGENPFMARACGVYHDIGKIKNPQFFVENQTDGYNPHDELIPEVSASMITRHVSNGKKILEEHHMPDEVIKAANEHHGDTPVMYFYLKAQGITEGELDMDQYRYEGPMPSNKYSAIIMICDVCEAMLRAKSFDTNEELDEMVGKIIRDKLLDGQFDHCELTVQDLVIIKETICKVYPAMVHKRIDYNKAKERR